MVISENEARGGVELQCVILLNDINGTDKILETLLSETVTLNQHLFKNGFKIIITSMKVESIAEL